MRVSPCASECTPCWVGPLNSGDHLLFCHRRSCHCTKCRLDIRMTIYSSLHAVTRSCCRRGVSSNPPTYFSWKSRREGLPYDQHDRIMSSHAEGTRRVIDGNKTKSVYRVYRLFNLLMMRTQMNVNRTLSLRRL